MQDDTREPPTMPHRDPSTWQALLAWLTPYLATIYAAALSFVIALLRGLHAGGPVYKSVLEAGMVGGLTLTLKPLLDWGGLDPDMAVFFGGFIAFLGVEWLRAKSDALFDKVVGRWLR
ncbi:phage holin, lambda family [Cobetia marina]|uniref:phage holin, lambda family n=1 Tax=Cobetia marina TaxID=28258 RepID=UPI00384A6F77